MKILLKKIVIQIQTKVCCTKLRNKDLIATWLINKYKLLENTKLIASFFLYKLPSEQNETLTLLQVRFKTKIKAQKTVCHVSRNNAPGSPIARVAKAFCAENSVTMNTPLYKSTFRKGRIQQCVSTVQHKYKYWLS